MPAPNWDICRQACERASGYGRPAGTGVPCGAGGAAEGFVWRHVQRRRLWGDDGGSEACVRRGGSCGLVATAITSAGASGSRPRRTIDR